MPNKILLPLIATALNSYLKFDPEMQQQLKKFETAVIRVNITTFDWTFFIKIHNEKLELIESTSEPIDASLKAGITALIKAGFSDKTAISTELELQGNVAMLQAITAIFKAVEIDWEELIANYTGDTIAHGVSQLVESIAAMQQQIFTTKKLNIKEYLQEEIKLLLSAYEVQDFCNDVDAFRDQVERLNAKIQILESHAKKN